MVSLLTIAGSLVVMSEPSFGLGEPSIEFLNPSSFAMAGERGIILSDAAPDSGPGADATEGRYRFSAWVANAPVGSRVFFAVQQRTIDIEIAASETSNTDSTWEADWQIPATILDGPATVNAYLVVGDEAIDTAVQPVTIMSTQERAELAYPQSGGSFGTFAPLASELPASGGAARKKPIGIVDAPYWSGIDITYIRTFYTTSAPGTKPVWKVCGTEDVGDSSNSYADNGVRCQLTSAADQTVITAMATVANDSPDDYENRFNEAGDAVALSSSYAQTPTNLSLVTNGLQRAELEPVSEEFYCSTTEILLLEDQLGRQIAGANIDVHATGPSDALKFHTHLVLASNVAPDRGPHTIEEAFDCTGQKFQGATSPPSNAAPWEQGEHSRFGLPDRKHIESAATGTNDIGRFSFALHSPVKGTTNWTAWLDETDDGCQTNDDAFTEGEFFVNGAIGWAEDPGDPTSEPYDVFVPCTGTTPTPDPTPTDDPGTDPDGSRTVSLRMTNSPSIGERAEFEGRIIAARAACERDQKVVLKIRRPNSKYWTVTQTRTDASGRFSLFGKARVPRDYRAVAPGSSSCDRAASQPIKLRAQ
jgi:hypothetical protein